MKITDNPINVGNKIEVSVKKQQEVELPLEGTIKPQAGHKIWEVNTVTGEIKQAEYKRDTAAFNGLVKLENEKLIIKPNCIYIPALNIKNAKKKYENDANQSSYFVKPAPMNLSDLFS